MHTTNHTLNLIRFYVGKAEMFLSCDSISLVLM